MTLEAKNPLRSFYLKSLENTAVFVDKIRVLLSLKTAN